jgi:hypothetical protein
MKFGQNVALVNQHVLIATLSALLTANHLDVNVLKAFSDSEKNALPKMIATPNNQHHSLVPTYHANPIKSALRNKSNVLELHATQFQLVSHKTAVSHLVK